MFRATAFTSQTHFCFSDSRKYQVPIGDMINHRYHTVSGTLASSESTEEIAECFVKHKDYLAYTHIAYAVHHMDKFKMDKSMGFWKIILPRTKLELENLDRNGITGFFQTVVAMGNMQVQDNELWSIIEKQLLDGRMHRYL